MEKTFAGCCKIAKFVKISPSKVSRYTVSLSLITLTLLHTQMLMNVTGTMVVVVKSAPILLARLNAAATVDISSSETVNNVEV